MAVMAAKRWGSGDCPAPQIFKRYYYYYEIINDDDDVSLPLIIIIIIIACFGHSQVEHENNKLSHICLDL